MSDNHVCGSERHVLYRSRAASLGINNASVSCLAENVATLTPLIGPSRKLELIKV